MAAPPPRRGRSTPVSVAPMMQYSDRHFRVLLRQLTRHTLLYTEMITTGSLLHGDRPSLLDYSALEHPLALQLGGEDPEALAECKRIGTDWGYDEINLNVGCPSERVQQARFGAALMAEPDSVARAVEAMRAATSLPVTVKHRIGIDDKDSYEDLAHFVERVSSVGCDRFTVHARKAWLQGLSPKENRTIPPLRYADVYRLKSAFPDLDIEINGGFTTLEAMEEALQEVDAVMVGRAAVDNPYLFASVDSRFFDDHHPQANRKEVVEAMAAYAEDWVSQDSMHRVGPVLRPLLHLFSGLPGARRWRRLLSERAFGQDASPEVLSEGLELVQWQLAEIG